MLCKYVCVYKDIGVMEESSQAKTWESWPVPTAMCMHNHYLELFANYEL